MKRTLIYALGGDVVVSFLIILASFLSGEYGFRTKEIWVCSAISVLWVCVYSFMIRYTEKNKNKTNEIAIVAISIILVFFCIMFLIQSLRDGRYLPLLIVNKAPVMAICTHLVLLKREANNGGNKA